MLKLKYWVLLKTDYIEVVIKRSKLSGFSLFFIEGEYWGHDDRYYVPLYLLKEKKVKIYKWKKAGSLRLF